MALNYKTFYKIPQLHTYADALEHYNNIKPIRGDEHGTRPCGRRDQPWFSIWLDPDDKSVVVGYGRHELPTRRKLVSYHPAGEIAVYKRGGYSSASCNERMDRLLRTTFRTYQYDTWVNCAWYDGREKRKGVLPLDMGVRGDHTQQGAAVFVRDTAGDLVYMNYQYPVTHVINKPEMRQFNEQIKPFTQFVSSIRRLQGGELSFSSEAYAEYFGWADHKNYWGEKVPNYPLSSLRWQSSHRGDEDREQFLEWAKSDDRDDHMRAAMVVAYCCNRADTHGFTTDVALYTDPQRFLVRQIHTEGKLVKDRYRRYMRS
jgi:hypothetical protein